MTQPILVDTSSLYALLDADDVAHAEAARTFRRLVEEGATLITHTFIVVETSALVQRRLPPEALRDLHRRILAVVTVLDVPKDVLDRAVAALLAAPAGPSLVDRVSFETMAAASTDRALAYDRHFAAAGLTCV